MIRQLDEQGRISIPKEMRKQFDWNRDTKLMIKPNANGVSIFRATNSCCVCGSENDLRILDVIGDETKMCMKCIKEIKDL